MPSISMRMVGKKIAAVMKSNERLLLRAENGDEMHIAWLDENNKPTKGRPVIVWYGRHVRAKTAHLGVRPHSVTAAPGL